MRMTIKRIISADSHFVEPPDLFTTRVAVEFRDRAPRTWQGTLPDGRSGEFFTAPGIDPQAVAGTYGAGQTRVEMLERNKAGFEGAPAFVSDPMARVTEQDNDGVSAEVLYTSWGLFLFTIEDPAMRAECFRAFNSWAAEFCSSQSERLVGCGIVEPCDGVDAAIKELNRIAERGLHACMISGSTGDLAPYGSAQYDPFWATAQDVGIPLSLHILTGRKGFQIIPQFDGDNRGLVTYVTQVTNEIQTTCAEIIAGGVCQRFPEIKFILAEADIAWIPGFLQRFDHYYTMSYRDRLKLGLLPSEYFKQNFTATFQFEGMNLAHVVNVLGSDRLMWASDFPHMDSTFPNSKAYVTDLVKDLAQHDQDNISHKTAERLFQLSPSESIGAS
jgi:predicted TIM-barrel fold metal-dependent hydrolase